MGAGKGLVIVVIGKQDTGKTTFTKGLVKQNGKPNFIFDARNEYGGRPQPFPEFLAQAVTKRNTNIVIEEATVYLSNKGDSEDLKNILSGRSHYNNNVLILYHSLRTVPTYIFDLADFYVLFKTNDNLALIANKFKFNDVLLEDFQSVKQSEDPHFHIVRKIDI